MAGNPRILSGVVRDPNRNPVAQARVYFTHSPVSLPDIAVLTDSNGRFSLSVPSSGTYTIEAVADGFAPSTATATIMDNQEKQLEIELKR
jgi:hypothetical protein